MPDFNVRSDSVNVEQIMEQIRARIREKRGVDYTEQQIRELAAVKLERFLDPRGVRSDLLDQFRKAQPAYEPPELPNFAFEDATLFESHRAPIRWIRRLLSPLLKMLFNPNPLIQALHIQARLNTINAERDARREAARRQMDQLYYELVHNLVVETTRTGIEVKNLTMRVESIASRLEFNERRARALEGAVVYKAPEPDEAPAARPAPPIQQPRHQPPPRQQQPRYSPPQPAYAAPAQAAPAAPVPQAAIAAPVAAAEQPAQGQQAGQGQGPPEGPGQRSRRRRRRRGRRGGGAASAVMGGPGSAAPGAPADAPESGDDVDQMDAEDRMDDDGSPEPEETPGAAADHLVAPAVAAAPRADAPLERARVEQLAPPPVEQLAPPPAEQLAPTPAEQLAPTPAEQLALPPVEQLAIWPVEQLAIRPVEQLAIRPVEQSAPPAEQPAPPPAEAVSAAPPAPGAPAEPAPVPPTRDHADRDPQ
jgi:hypothetical protein